MSVQHNQQHIVPFTEIAHAQTVDATCKWWPRSKTPWIRQRQSSRGVANAGSHLGCWRCSVQMHLGSKATSKYSSLGTWGIYSLLVEGMKRVGWFQHLLRLPFQMFQAPLSFEQFIWEQLGYFGQLSTYLIYCCSQKPYPSPASATRFQKLSQ